VKQGDAMCLEIVIARILVGGPVEYVLSFHQSLLKCLCQSLGTVKRYNSSERSQLGFRGWLGLAGSGLGSVSWKLHLKQLHAAAAGDLPPV
jgi:hypothetical protein